jgi:hypothetical protein
LARAIDAKRVDTALVLPCNVRTIRKNLIVRTLQGSTKFVWGAVGGGTEGGTVNTALASPRPNAIFQKAVGAVQGSGGQWRAVRGRTGP